MRMKPMRKNRIRTNRMRTSSLRAAGKDTKDVGGKEPPDVFFYMRRGA